MLVDGGTDPREVERDRQTAAVEKKATAAAKVEADKLASITVHEVWLKYCEIRRPYWGDLHYQDHITKIQPGGVQRKKRGGAGLTIAQPLAALMPLALKDLDQPTVETWAAKEGQSRPTSARLAWRLLTVFLTWCSEQPEYATLLPAKNPAKTKKSREALGKAGTKKDVLQKGQLEAWFAAVRQIGNPTISACLQVLLLTGARLNEVLTMRWEDVNTQWKGIHINDKVEGSREIPLTYYVESLITALPRRNQYVFASARALAMNEKNIARRERKCAAKGKTPPAGAILETSATGYITEPNTPHTRACKVAGLEGLTLHGLRRSFKSLTEWLEVPLGVVAQIQGHKPSATAEKHYTVRPLELLALHHQRIEAWILEQAGIVFDAKAEPAGLRVVGQSDFKPDFWGRK
jgi:integrase